MTKQVVAMVVVLGVLSAGAYADDLHGARSLLCAPVEATLCTPDGGCETGAPWKWNIPGFIVVDLAAKMLSTTEASKEQRTTPIRTLERDGDFLFVQGIEMGRAFSFVLNESTGTASFAVARSELTVTGFGSCTPLGKMEP